MAEEKDVRRLCLADLLLHCAAEHAPLWIVSTFTTVVVEIDQRVAGIKARNVLEGHRVIPFVDGTAAARQSDSHPAPGAEHGTVNTSPGEGGDTRRIAARIEGAR